MRFLINVLLDVQDRYGYLPLEELERISKEFGVPLSRLYSIITFYPTFSLKRKAKHTILICKGTACVMRGSDVLEDFIRKIADGVEFDYRPIRCFGACSLAPVIVVDGRVCGRMSVSKLREIVARVKSRDRSDEVEGEGDRSTVLRR